jgi:hypothetical protein
LQAEMEYQVICVDGQTMLQRGIDPAPSENSCYTKIRQPTTITSISWGRNEQSTVKMFPGTD